ncbi:MAG: response regulator transcription factor [Chloroflexi bacterium]|nr:response regulator transcription factor [Chloroflexota bacterium]
MALPEAQATEDKISLALVEDEDLYRDLLRVALSQHPRLQVVGAFADGETALEAVPRLQPRVALLDIELRGRLNGIQLGLLLRRRLPDLGVVLLSNHGEPQFVASLPPAALPGWSYLLKKSVSDIGALLRAIEGAAAGLVVLDPQLVAGLRPRTGGELVQLSPRQRQILGLIAQGFTNAAIAQQLVLAEKSVENQINLLYRELGIDRQESALHPRVKAVLLYLQESYFQGTGKSSG